MFGYVVCHVVNVSCHFTYVMFVMFVVVERIVQCVHVFIGYYDTVEFTTMQVSIDVSDSTNTRYAMSYLYASCW